MSIRLKCVCFLIVLIFTLFISSCREKRRELGFPSFFTVQDKKDNDRVEIKSYGQDGRLRLKAYKKEPHRVIAVHQNSVETILALGAGKNLFAAVGVERELLCDKYKKEYEDIPYKLSYGVEREFLIMHNPDLIVAWYSTFSQGYLGDQKEWNARGIDTYIAPSSFGRKGEIQTLNDEYSFILALGKIFEKEKEAKMVIEEMNHEIDRIVKLTERQTEKPKCIIIEFEGKELRAYGENTLGGNILMHLGIPLAYAQNHLGYEDLIIIDPDIIFVVNLDETPEGGQIQEELVYNTPGFGGIKAVKNHRVYAVPLYEIYCSGVRSYDGIVRFAQNVYPELFVKE